MRPLDRSPIDDRAPGEYVELAGERGTQDTDDAVRGRLPRVLTKLNNA
jgi:hypothetical protein